MNVINSVQNILLILQHLIMFQPKLSTQQETCSSETGCGKEASVAFLFILISQLDS